MAAAVVRASARGTRSSRPDGRRPEMTRDAAAFRTAAAAARGASSIAFRREEHHATHDPAVPGRRPSDTGVKALIGHSGFIGGHLACQRRWDACFNRANVEALRGRAFELLVCAGLPSDRWRANGNPAGDRSNMMSLANALAGVRAKRFVLVSTVDVYPVPVAVDETTPIDPPGHRAYGEHRLEFERIVADRFPECRIVRLPSVFGAGMRRNALLDLIRRRELDAVDPRSAFQWYPATRLADDLDRLLEADLPLVNLCTEPVETGRLHREYFDDLRIGGRPGPVVRHDVRTRHGRRFGGGDRYVMSAEDVVLAIGGWLRSLGQFGELRA
jgi:hypothetical protein